MRPIALIIAACLLTTSTGCYKNPQDGKPVAKEEVRLPLEQLSPERARSDAIKARNRGDFHLLGVYGYAATVPGVEGHVSNPVLFIEDTSDQVRDAGHSRFNKRASLYAAAYNRELLSKPD